MAGLYGDLWGVPEIQQLWFDFNSRSTLAQQFGWEKKGIGGKFSLESSYEPYHVHRDAPARVEKLHTNAVWKFDSHYTAPMWPTGGVACSGAIAAEWFGKNYLFPKWFFDWGKAYLDQLRRHQPSFDAAPEIKLVWVTHVAWTLNMMLSATNVHGTVLPLAIYSAATGRPVPIADPFIMPAQHFEAFPTWWRDRMQDAARALVESGKYDAKGHIDFGYKVLGMDGQPVGVSYWQGTPWSAPFEVKRLRWDATGLAGATFNNGQPNDPFYVPDSGGNRYNDKGATLDNYARWSHAVPWVAGIQAWGKLRDSKAYDKTGDSMLREALRMSTFFGGAGGDARFWTALTAWKASPSPKLVQVRAGQDLQIFGKKLHLPALYQPNAELSFRYHYPAMIDTLLRCDYAALVAAGHNAWWFYNIGPKAAAIGVTCDSPDVARFDAEGAPRRDRDGIPLVQGIAPNAVPLDAHLQYKNAKARAEGISFVVNWVSTWVNVVMIVLQGDYTKAYDIGKGWYDHFTMKFPKPEDLWRGIVPPSPIAMRTAMVSRTVYDGRNWVTGYGEGPLPKGEVGEMLRGLADCAETWTSTYGAPLVGMLNKPDMQNVWVGRAGEVSPQFVLLPEPGTSSPPPMAMQVTSAPRTSWLPLAAALTAVGAFTAYQLNRRRRR